MQVFFLLKEYIIKTVTFFNEADDFRLLTFKNKKLRIENSR